MWYLIVSIPDPCTLTYFSKNVTDINTPWNRVCAINRTSLGCYENLIRSDLFIYPSHRIDSNTPESRDCQISNYFYPYAGHVITDSIDAIPYARVRNIISKGPKNMIPSNTVSPKCRREIAASLNEFSNRWCKRENVKPDALKEWKITI